MNMNLKDRDCADAKQLEPVLALPQATGAIGAEPGHALEAEWRDGIRVKTLQYHVDARTPHALELAQLPRVESAAKSAASRAALRRPVMRAADRAQVECELGRADHQHFAVALVFVGLLRACQPLAQPLGRNPFECVVVIRLHCVQEVLRQCRPRREPASSRYASAVASISCCSFSRSACWRGNIVSNAVRPASQTSTATRCCSDSLKAALAASISGTRSAGSAVWVSCARANSTGGS